MPATEPLPCPVNDDPRIRPRDDGAMAPRAGDEDKLWLRVDGHDERPTDDPIVKTPDDDDDDETRCCIKIDAVGVDLIGAVAP